MCQGDQTGVLEGSGGPPSGHYVQGDQKYRFTGRGQVSWKDYGAQEEQTSG